MAKTVAQMIPIITDALGKSQNASSISGALLQDRCIDFLNWGQQRIARFYSFHELNVLKDDAATVASVNTYPWVTGTNNLGLTRPKDIQSIRLIDSQDTRVLIRKSVRWYDQNLPLVTNYGDGRPHLYVRWGNSIEVFRRPDAVYTLAIRYPQWATDLTISSTASDFENKDQLLIVMAILEGYLHFEEYDDAAIWLAKALGLLTDAVRAEGDVDWEPQAEAMYGAYGHGRGGYASGEPWLDPYGDYGDPLHGYPN